MAQRGFWDDQRILKEARLSALWEVRAGHEPKYSAGAISRMLAEEFCADCTRNKVIGKASRMGLSRRASPIAKSVEQQKIMAKKAAATRDRRRNLSESERAEENRHQRHGRYDTEIVRSDRPSHHIKETALALPGVAATPRRKPFSGYLITTCQYIALKPSIHDSCKCGDPALWGVAYCQKHYDICHLTGLGLFRRRGRVGLL